MKRRQLIKNIGLAAGAIAVAGSSSSAPREKEAKQKRVLRIAHITDVHIRPEHNAPQRFRRCMEEIKKHKVDFFLNS